MANLPPSPLPTPPSEIVAVCAAAGEGLRCQPVLVRVTVAHPFSDACAEEDLEHLAAERRRRMESRGGGGLAGSPPAREGEKLPGACWTLLILAARLPISKKRKILQAGPRKG
uniref:Uncharacterized protein n=1 Tax=Oryza punctata TaxID=4537 RepID=A0A0E0M3W7_ORYPU